MLHLRGWPLPTFLATCILAGGVFLSAKTYGTSETHSELQAKIKVSKARSTGKAKEFTVIFDKITKEGTIKLASIKPLLLSEAFFQSTSFKVQIELSDTLLKKRFLSTHSYIQFPISKGFPLGLFWDHGEQRNLPTTQKNKKAFAFEFGPKPNTFAVSQGVKGTWNINLNEFKAYAQSETRPSVSIEIPIIY